MVLPSKPIEVVDFNPTSILIYGAPKVGKTTLAAALEDNLLVGFEEGSKFVEALKVEVKTLEDMSTLKQALIEKKGDKKYAYKYITLDTVSSLEELAKPLALKMYKLLPISRKFFQEGGTDILTLPNGGGYYFLREAFQKLVDTFIPFCESLILIGHLKDKSINIKGVEVNTRDIQLTGKLANIVAGAVDAVAFIHREGDKVFFNFQSNDTLVCGARPPHLLGKDILISEKINDGEIKIYWDKIFIPED